MTFERVMSALFCFLALGNCLFGDFQLAVLWAILAVALGISGRLKEMAAKK